MSESITDFLGTFVEQHSQNLTRLKRVRNGITLLKLLLFGVVSWLIYSLFVISNPLLWVSLFGAVVAFLVMTLVDSRQVVRIELTEALIAEAELELDYLKGDKTKLPTGSGYAEPLHPYAHDLDVLGDDSLFQSVNRTVTPRGERLLARRLLKGELSKVCLEERQQAVEELSGMPESMFLFRAWEKVFPVTRSDERTIEHWAESRPFVSNRWAKWAIYLSSAINLMLWGGVTFGIVNYVVPLLLSLTHLIVAYSFTGKINRQQQEVGELLGALGNLYYIVRHLRTLSFVTPLTRRLADVMFGNHNALTAFYALRKRMEGLDQRNNILVSVFLNALFMRDLHQILALDRWKMRYARYLNGWIDAVAEFDVLFSLANFRRNHSQFTFPRFTDQVVFHGESVTHPLIPAETAVGNDFTLGGMNRFFIITGANMSGKSTFLRSVGTNMVLALCGSVVAAERMECKPIDLFTSMRTTDNLSKGTSYFHAELLRLQQLVTVADSGTPLFIILDEMLKGTNSEDKLNGSYRFLQRLCSLPLCGIVATHDLELGRLQQEQPEHFFNRCFEIDHEGERIIYDYKLKAGVSKNMNASILLKQMGLI